MSGPDGQRRRGTLGGVVLGGVVLARVVLAGLPAAVLLTIDVVLLWGRTPEPHDSWWVVWQLSVGTACVATGVVVLLRGASRPAALFVAGGTALLLAAALISLGHTRAGGAAVAAACAGLIPSAVLHIPGRPVPGRSRASAWLTGFDVAVVVGAVVCTAGAASGQTVVGLVGGATTAVALVCSGWLQFEVTVGDERRRVLWLVLGTTASATAAGLLVTSTGVLPLSELAMTAVLTALSLVLPLCAGIAMTAPRVVDVRAVISRAVVGAAMLVLVLSAFAVAIAALRALGLDLNGPLGPAGIVAAGIAAAYHPVMLRVRTTTDELLFGGRPDAVNTLSRLGSDLSSGSSPSEWLATLRAALAVPAVQLWNGDTLVASAGPQIEDGDAASTMFLMVGQERVGDLVVALPSEQVTLPSSTRAVLTLVAGPLAQAVHATRLAEQLQASRGRVVAVLEEERRRMRRDLHDGLGPTLTGIAYSADAAANLLRADVDEAADLLRHLRTDAGAAIAEVRRIVYGLRPRALDELGLVGAVRQQVSRLHASDGRRLTVELDVPAQLPTLPAAVEVVAYRAAVEAVTNVARHAGVHAAHLQFAVEGDALVLTVHDDGQTSQDWVPGVGLTAMRERVEQVDGTLVLTRGPDGSTVRVCLPL